MNKRFIATAVVALGLIAPLPYVYSVMPSAEERKRRYMTLSFEGLFVWEVPLVNNIYRGEEIPVIFDPEIVTSAWVLGGKSELFVGGSLTRNGENWFVDVDAVVNVENDVRRELSGDGAKEEWRRLAEKWQNSK